MIILKLSFAVLITLYANFTTANEKNTNCTNLVSANTANPEIEVDIIALNILRCSLLALDELKTTEQDSRENVEQLIKDNILSNMDMDIATRSTIAKHWNDLSSAQQVTFKNYITNSIARDYANIFISYQDLNKIKITADKKVRYKDNKAIVKMIISINKNEPPFNVYMKMVKSDKWRIYDISFSGVNIVKSYKAQFDSHIKRKGINSLIEKISKKNKKK